jgi:SNF2 family DNA or RNA helicase
MQRNDTQQELNVEIFAAGWQTAIGRNPRIHVTAADLAAPECKARRLRLKPPRIHCQSFQFVEQPKAEVISARQPGPGIQASHVKPRAKIRLPQTTRTRFRPPRDVIRLQDRLYYTLQPPLESLLDRENLSFPMQPFPHQFEGIAFLYPRHVAILADEMGLGKTMQAATAIRMLLRRGEVRNVLLVCPKPLVTNWQREFEIWAPEIPLTVICGDKQKRSWQWRQIDAPVKLANYEVILRDAELVGDPDLHFDLVVVDEAQRIKNRLSSTSKSIRSISRTRSWAMTGTPVENSAEDLVGIFEFLSSGLLNSNMKPRRMASEVKDYIIRRTKETSLKDMPAKLIHDTAIELTAEQRCTYELAEAQGVLRLNDMGDSASIQHVFELVLRLKQICNFDPATESSHKMERLEADMEEIAASGKKAIVFSQWVETLKKISAGLSRFNPLEYHGRIPSNQRDAILKNFRERDDHHVILMSYGAGSVGLNLQFCNYVFLFDRWWNPAIEDQAINRAHRIGSTGSVTVTRFISTETIEERIHAVLEEKRELFSTIIGESSGGKRGLSQSEIYGLFGLKAPRQKRRAA